LNGTYHATLGIQTCNTLWIGRWGYFDASINPALGTDKNDVLFSGSETKGDYAEYAGTFQDAVIEGNGTYTVSLTDADFAGETTISQMHIATDIPVSDEIRFSDVSVKINGRTQITFDEGYIETDQKYLSGGMVILTMNHWRKPLEDLVVSNGFSVVGSGIDWVSGNGGDNVEVTFTVSGFAYDKPEAAEAETVSITPAAAAPDNGKADMAAETAAQADNTTENRPVIYVIIGAAAAVVIAAAAIAVIIVFRKKKRS
jgi:hypothetical protein